MTLTTEKLSAVETTKEFRALLKYMRAIAKAEPESVKEKCELESGLWQYASQKTIKAIVEHIDALELALSANREAQPAGFYTTVSGRKGVVWHTGAPEDDTAIYTAAPAPAVPELITEDEQEEAVNQGYANSFRGGWNACRAAMLNHVGDNNEKAAAKCECSSIDYCENCLREMLAQPVSSGYKLPDGFKLMLLEMTDEIGEAIAMEARCCGGIALCIYEAALAAAAEGGNGA
ncbi:hypothetical protein OSC18_26560 [Serratia nevei]|uniref:hypothetical protein n=1 Tax=Serratia nevei TaxID=2703794 RepID=UPI0028675658|nr:hypothetical protein [Serratia nevei]MDR8493038.1 hypothetical protein [Serratia nevei]